MEKYKNVVDKTTCRIPGTLYTANYELHVNLFLCKTTGTISRVMKSSRASHLQAAFGDEALQRIRASRVLVVGAGGIGW